MKNISIIATLWVALLYTSLSTFAQALLSEQEQRIQSSYIMAFNRNATKGEVDYWKTQGNLDMTKLLARHKDYIKRNPGLWEGILNVSYTDAFGRAITDGERNFHKQYPRTYFEMVTSHMDYLTKNPSVYDGVITNSYVRAFGRNPSNEELKYWRAQTKCAFIWLFRAHIEWNATKRANVASTSGVNKVFVSPALLTEVKLARASLVAAGGGNLIGNDGSTMVAAGGGNLVGNDGASMVAAGGGN
jgi:hypothetical protein